MIVSINIFGNQQLILYIQSDIYSLMTLPPSSQSSIHVLVQRRFINKPKGNMKEMKEKSGLEFHFQEAPKV